jgi:hypothetical protein
MGKILEKSVCAPSTTSIIKSHFLSLDTISMDQLSNGIKCYVCNEPRLRGCYTYLISPTNLSFVARRNMHVDARIA